jgi:hypothetical protein
MKLRLAFGQEVEIEDSDRHRQGPPRLMLFRDEDDLRSQAERQGLTVEEMIDVARRHNESVESFYQPKVK